MITYQDFKATSKREEFILEAIKNYKSSMTYLEAIENQAYYSRENTAIKRRMTFMEKHGVKKSKVKFFKLRNGFCKKMCKQLSGYLLGNCKFSCLTTNARLLKLLIITSATLQELSDNCKINCRNLSF